VVLASSLVYWLAIPDVIDNILKQSLTLHEGGFAWNLWRVPSFHIYTDYYIFNCTNYREVVEEGAVPNVVELGPYSFRESRVKNIINDSDPTVQYREHRLYHFSPEDTGDGLSLDDVVTTVNLGYMGAAKILTSLPSITPGLGQISDFLNSYLDDVGESPFMTVSVRQLLFEGWPLDHYIGLLRNISDVIDDLPVVPDLPDLPEHFSYGLFTNRNDTDDGLFECSTGVDDYRRFGQLQSWNGLPYLKQWYDGNETHCNKIQGTDGTIYPYDMDINQRAYIYQTDLCRLVYVEYEQDTIIHNLAGRKFVLPRDVLASPTENEENSCFCSSLDDPHCYGTGLIYVGACYGGLPLIGSQPHFYNADPAVQSTVSGLSPKKDDHETYVILEERTNILLHASKRVQVSVDMKKYKKTVFFRPIGLTGTFNLTDSYLPMVWFHERVDIDEGTASLFDLFLVDDISLGVLAGIGGLLVVIGAILIFIHYK